MKKKLMAITLVFTLAIAFPLMAWAAPSPSGNAATDSAGISVRANAAWGNIRSITASATWASNTVVDNNQIVVASFEVAGDATDVTLTFNIGSSYVGATTTVYVQHEDGTTEAISAIVDSNGAVIINIDKLTSAIFTVVADPTTAIGVKGDESSISPKTGIDMTAVAGGTAVSAFAAGIVFVGIRKRMAT